MIIPKAVFLNYTYRKVQCGQFDSIRQESQRVLGQLVMDLRNPEIHSLGETRAFFLAEQYPRLSQQPSSTVWDTLISHFILAGYHIEVQHTKTGFFITLSWKQLPNHP